MGVSLSVAANETAYVSLARNEVSSGRGVRVFTPSASDEAVFIHREA